MAVRLRIAELLEARGMNAHQLFKRSGKRLSQTHAYRLARNEGVGLKLDVIDLLCELLDCAPGDLFARD